jgi:hypothetical protein
MDNNKYVELEEPKDGDLIDVKLVKQLTGGDVYYVRYLYNNTNALPDTS